MLRYSCLPVLAVFAFVAPSCRADQFAVLGSANTYAVLAASTVTNTGPTVLAGNLGLTPGSSITGFAPGQVVDGSVYVTDLNASTAQADALSGYVYLEQLAATQNLTGQDLGGQILTPGVYLFTSSAQLTGPLTLDFGGMNGADFVFQIGSTLTTASDATVTVLNQGLDDAIYWQVGSSATLGTGTHFQGDIVADASVTLNTGATINCGSAIALNGAVTLDTNVIRNCATTGSDVTTAVPTGVTPEPSSLWLAGSGLVAGFSRLKRRFS